VAGERKNEAVSLEKGWYRVSIGGRPATCAYVDAWRGGLMALTLESGWSRVDAEPLLWLGPVVFPDASATQGKPVVDAWNAVRLIRSGVRTCVYVGRLREDLYGFTVRYGWFQLPRPNIEWLDVVATPISAIRPAMPRLVRRDARKPSRWSGTD
jgi:hypothetical protein